MPQQCKSFVPSVAALVAVTAIVLATSGATRAADDCLAGPNGQAAPGTHWYYHLDRTTHRTCWYLGQIGQPVHRVLHAKTQAVETPAAESPNATSDSRAEPRRSSTATAEAVAPKPRQEVPLAAAWPDTQGSATGVGTNISAAAADVPVQEVDSGESTWVAASAAKEESAVPQPVAARPANPATAIFMRILPMVAAALAIAGLLQHTIFRLVFGRRLRPALRPQVARKRSGRVTGSASDEVPAFLTSRVPEPAHVPTQRIDPQVIEAAMQQILRAVERKAA